MRQVAPVPVVVFYVTGHGFGHASRVIEVINAAIATAAGIRIHVRTTAPRWFFDLAVRGELAFDAVECDTGVVQIDSLRPDIRATVRRAAAFYERFAERTEVEAAWLDTIRPALVVADLPPLALAAAARAGVPAVGLGNFTWDWIYEGYTASLGDAAWLPGLLGDAQSTAAEAWRLPMHGGFAPYRRIVDLPFVARHAGRDRRDVRRALGVDSARPVVLVSFGGFGLQCLPLDAIAAGTGATVVTTDVPGAASPRREDHAPIAQRRPGGVVAIDEAALYAAGFRYEDVVGASDVVVSKPGYGIIAECIANGAAMLYTSRGAFAEYDVLVREMPRYLKCRFITNDDLLAGRWRPHLDALLTQPAAPERAATNGAQVAASRLLTWIG
jgi:hypothetical protein